MRLRTGQAAPDFSTATFDDAPVRLADHRGHPTWLAFFRYAGCPLCNLRVHETIKRHDALAARGLRLLAVFQSPARSINEYVAAQKPPFPLIADPEERLYKLYGLESSLLGYASPENVPALARAATKGFLPGRMEGTKTRLPADFLIDRDGVIRDVFYGRVIAEHIPFERVESFLG